MFDKRKTGMYNKYAKEADMIAEEKLKILTESAKYDASCSSSGSERKNSKNGLGNGYSTGCCHSFTPDGRCISLLKILLSNDCLFSCRYCVNRCDNDVPRATASPDEICSLVVDFYKRNYIEGLFLSSAVFVSPDHTMEQLLLTVKKLRTEYHFNGYIHLKAIPRADGDLVREAARYADRMSYNIELPSEQSLRLLAPQKSKECLLLPMKRLSREREIFRAEKRKGYFLPAGQTTQVIVGASPEKDGHILRLSEGLYRGAGLKRVYYSSYVPVVHDSFLPETAGGALREHRLYQADWLLRFYGFSAEELLPEGENLPLEYDPKCAWAIAHPEIFPVEINRASLETLLRVPGIGARSAQKILLARKTATLRFEHLARMRVVLKRARHFITCNGKYFGAQGEQIKLLLAGEEQSENAQQLSLFSLLSSPENARMALTGEL